MKDRVKTLLLYANGTPHPRLLAEETILRGVLGLREDDAEPAKPRRMCRDTGRCLLARIPVSHSARVARPQRKSDE